MGRYHHLTRAERERIFRLHNAKVPAYRIAQDLGYTPGPEQALPTSSCSRLPLFKFNFEIFGQLSLKIFAERILWHAG